MNARIVPLLLLVATVSCKDLIKGQDVGLKIFDEKKEASPAIWKQAHNFTISANDSDVISKVIVTDLREDKDGEARIVEGGPGNKNVTIEVKSPTVLRGYDYHIEVFAVSVEEITPELTFDDNNDTVSTNTPTKGLITEQAFDDMMTRLNGTGNINISQNPDMEHPGVIAQDRSVRSSESTTETAANTKVSSTSPSSTTSTTTLSPGNLKNNQDSTNIGDTSSTTISGQSTLVPPTIINKDQTRFVRDVKSQLENKETKTTERDSISTTEEAQLNTNTFKTTPILSTPKPNITMALPPIALSKDVKINDQRFLRDVNNKDNQGSTKIPDIEIPIQETKENKTSELETDNLDHTFNNQGSVSTPTGIVTAKPFNTVSPVVPLGVGSTDPKVDPNTKENSSSTVKPVISIQ